MTGLFQSPHFYEMRDIDHHLGRLFRHLKETGTYDNTLFIFFSDNGANGNEMHQYPGTDKAWLDRNSDNRYENMGRRFSRVAQGPAWAQVSMTPFRLFKGFTTEGGIRSPLIISGPGVTNQGTHNDAFAHVMDITATILDAAGVDHPGTFYKGRKVEPLRGRSMMKVLNGKANIIYDNDTAVNWEMLGFRAVRKGDFKLVWLPIHFGNDDWQLYDLSKDPAELNDVSKEQPKLRKEMINFCLNQPCISALGNPGYLRPARRVAQKIETDRKLKKGIVRLERQINLSRMKTPMSFILSA